MALKYGGKTKTHEYKYLRGPCPNGYHIPTNDEWNNVLNYGVTLGAWVKNNGSGSKETSGIPFMTYMHTPLVSYIKTDGEFVNWTRFGFRRYRTAEHYGSGSAPKHKGILNGYGNVTIETGVSSGSFACLPIRPFKDIPSVPDNTWTMTYDGSSVAQGAGIFHNPSLGLISISIDGENWITLCDKNLGATSLWVYGQDYNQYGDTYNEAKAGKIYQRGNDYPFPSVESQITTTTTTPDVSSYGPSNHYSSSTLVLGNDNWFSPINSNLWGYDDYLSVKPVDIIERYYGGKTIVNYEDMQGPCPTGFHVSTSKDWTRAMNIGISLGAWDSTGDHMSVYLKIPPTGLRTIESEFYGDGEMSFYLTPEIVDDEDFPGWYYPKAFQFVFNERYSLPNEASLGGASICDGCSIRPFKNVSVVPDNNWTVLYQGSGSAGIFHDETSGLISLSSDGENRITLADKNLGATEVYNYGDTLSHSNCGKLYQWGNNFGFLWQGNLVTTTTKVDGSLYGPGNYYSFNEYYIDVGDMTDRSSVRNDNRRGGVTGAERPAKVIEVYYNTTKIRPFYPAGIYWNPNIDGGIISLSANGIDWLTLSDKNLGATTVYNLGDTMSEANCGKFYQRGNNYGFSYSGTPSRSSTKVDVSSYGPNNYYSNSTFRRVNYTGNWRTDASTTAAFNLWGGVTGTLEAMQGPCPNGFHIPSRGDVTNLVSMYIGLDILSDTDSQAYLKIPRMGVRDNYSAAINNAGTDGGFRSCTINTEPYETTYYPYACECWNESQYQIQLSTGLMNSHCLGIRPFRNTAIIPDDGWTKIL